jgi:hypothetical protein
MAVRSGAGTGVVVSLVVFVLTTVFLLVLTIVFYAGKSKETELKAAAESTLATYIKPNQRNVDAFKAFEAAAKSEGKSVAEYLNARYSDLMTFVGGDPSGNLDTVKNEFRRFQLKENDTVRSRMQDMFRDLNARQTEIDGLSQQIKSLSAQISEKEAQINRLNEAHKQEVAAVEGRIASYRDAGEDYRKRLETALGELSRAKDSLRVQYESRIRELQEENDNISRERQRLIGRVQEFERRANETRVRGQNPSMLVDGKIIDAPGTNDEVFIDRGRKDRIVNGMTFEVYSEPSQIRLHPQTGEMPRGKASIQVRKVGETTSTCKITRMTPGQPVIKNDVIANAVYDPQYKFKFLMHGKFDIDGDGKPTETEAEYLRSMVVSWGGAVVMGDDLPGDLDFLVLGAEPPKPPPPPQDAPAAVIADWVRKNEANAKYHQLFNEAQNAQIPVLNANRFLILIGYTDR